MQHVVVIARGRPFSTDDLAVLAMAADALAETG
jgi:hypothetical protein